MASQGPRYPGTAANLSNAGTSENTDAWTTPANVGSDNGTESTIVAPSYDSPDISQILVASNFGFTIPTGSTIDGIVVEIERRSIVANSGKDFRVQLAKGTTFASLVGNNKAVPATIWPTTATVASYGTGTTDLWGTTWTPAEVNASSFALFLSAQANIANADIGVDFIRVTVHYTPPAGFTGSGGGTIAAATATGTAALRFSGASAATVAAATASASGTRSEEPGDYDGPGAYDSTTTYNGLTPISGTASVQAAAASSSSSGSLSFSGSITAAAAAAAAASSGSLRFTATAAATAAPATVSTTGALRFSGSASATAPAANASGSGTNLLHITGTAGVAVPAATASANGTMTEPGDVAGTASVSAPAALAAAVGRLAFIGIADASVLGPGVSGAGGIILRGTAATAAMPPTATATGEVAEAPGIEGAALLSDFVIVMVVLLDAIQTATVNDSAYYQAIVSGEGSA